MGSPFDELRFDATFAARGVIIGRIAPDERERVVANRTAKEVGRCQGLTFGQRFSHQGRTIFGELDAVGHGMDSLGQLQQSMAFAGTRVQDEAFTSGGRSKPIEHSGDGCWGSGIVAAFDLRYESGHY